LYGGQSASHLPLPRRESLIDDPLGSLSYDLCPLKIAIFLWLVSPPGQYSPFNAGGVVLNYLGVFSLRHHHSTFSPPTRYLVSEGYILRSLLGVFFLEPSPL